MKSIPHAKRNANANLRGKKTMAANCLCCMWQDFREAERVKNAEREMDDEEIGK